MFALKTIHLEKKVSNENQIYSIQPSNSIYSGDKLHYLSILQALSL